MNVSLLQKKRLAYQPVVPEILRDLNHVRLRECAGGATKPEEALRRLFPKTFDGRFFTLEKGKGEREGPLKIGAVFSGGQAAGGLNVLGGIFHGLKTIDPRSHLFGFLDGPSGIVKSRKRELLSGEIELSLNRGGFDLIGTGRTKIETQEQLASSLSACHELSLDGLVVIGGDDSNTNAAVLAEYFLQNGCKTRVIGVPKTIDGDLRSTDIELSFGFDSACKTYSEIIGNIACDALSARKYYHFIKLMGRSASHITLECALSTHPNLVFIGEERKSLDRIVNETADLICKRYEAGKEYGIILIPEGLIEFIPEIGALIEALNRSIAENPTNLKGALERLSNDQKTLLESFNEKIRNQLVSERDPHGNVQVSQIDTQLLLIDLVKKELKGRNFKGKFSVQDHFLGYEGRSCFPSNFDANYAYSLGRLAALGVRDGVTGVICSMQHLKQGPLSWKPKMVPIIQLMHLELRNGKEKPVIRKAVVDLQGPSFRYLTEMRKVWETQDDYSYPGPIQFFGDAEITDSIPLSL